MWKIAVGFVVFAAISLFVIMKAGDKVDMSGEKQQWRRHAAPATAPARPEVKAFSIDCPYGRAARPRTTHEWPLRAVSVLLEFCPTPKAANDTGLHPDSRCTPAQSPEPRPRHPHRRDDGGHRPERLGQVEPGVRHALCRGPAPLCRDLLGLRAPVPRPHGQAGGRQGGGRAAGHRHRPDQPGALLALDRRHDDRAERPPEAAVRARRPAVRPRDGVAGAARLARFDLRRAGRARGRRRRSARGADLPGRAAGQHQRPRR